METRPSEPVLHRRRRTAWIAAIGLPLMTLWGASELLGRPVLGGQLEGRSQRAAIAIRDHVQPVEILGTWSFVLPRLESSYAEVRHFTQGPRDGWVNDDQREAFVAALTELLQRYDSVDLFLLAHTNSYHNWVAEIPAELRLKIRMVYNSGCWCGRQAEQWIEMGARSYVAHPSAASHIAFFVPFFRRWIAGADLESAVAESNQHAERLYTRLTVLGAELQRQYDKWSVSHAQIWGERELSIGASR